MNAFTAVPLKLVNEKGRHPVLGVTDCYGAVRFVVVAEKRAALEHSHNGRKYQMKKCNTRAALLSCSACCAIAIMPAAALAQDSSGGLEEIVVTAQ